MTTKYEVRCCCVPKKLLGWLEWPDDGRRSMEFTLLETRAQFPWTNGGRPVQTHTIVLEVHRYAEYGSDDPLTADAPGRHRLAVKAEGVPIETLRRISGFTENLQSPRGSRCPSHRGEGPGLHLPDEA